VTVAHALLKKGADAKALNGVCIWGWGGGVHYIYTYIYIDDTHLLCLFPVMDIFCASLCCYLVILVMVTK
jgi:hypothetical protein